MLARIKYSYDQIKNLLLSMDEVKLSVENLKSLKQYVPTDDEINLLKSYDGDIELLGTVEKYFMAVMEIPNLSTRLECMIFKRRVESELQEITLNIATALRGFDELKQSIKLKNVLKICLMIGNFMNGTSFRGNAKGFQLEALLKIKDVKSAASGMSNGISSLLHFIVKKVEFSSIDYLSEMPNVEASCKLGLSNLFTIFSTFQAEYKKMEKDVATYNSSICKNDKFSGVMNSFTVNYKNAVDASSKSMEKLKQECKAILLYFGEEVNDNNASSETVKILELFYSFGLLLRTTAAELQNKKSLSSSGSNEIGMKDKDANKTRQTVRIDIGREELEAALEGLKRGSKQLEDRKAKTDKYLVC